MDYCHEDHFHGGTAWCYVKNLPIAPLPIAPPAPTIQVTPTTATMKFRLPSAFASAWSPGFDLHVTGVGRTEQEARESLAVHLVELADSLLTEARNVHKTA